MSARRFRLPAAVALSALLLAPAAASATTYIWQMSCSEDQVNNSGVGDGSTDSTATGEAHLRLDTLTGRLSWEIDWNGLEGLLTAIHIHGPADAGSSNMAHIFNVYTGEPDVIAAGVDRTTDSIYDFDELADLIASSGGAHNEENSTTFMVDEMAYVNIHSQLWMAGEIRCHYQLVSTLMGQEQTKDQQRCTNKMRKHTGKVAKVTAKAIAKCIKLSGKSGPIDVETCINLEALAKLAKPEQKVIDDFAKFCGDGVGPTYPAFGVTNAGDVFGTSVVATASLASGVFGDLNTGVAGPGDVANCQFGLWKGLSKCHDALLKDYATCTKQDLAGKVGLTAVEGYNLEKCFATDRKGKVAKACAPTDSKIRKLLDKKCDGVDLTLALPDCAEAAPEDAVACMARESRCWACQAANSADNLSIPCDEIDDGVANLSCS